MADAHAKHHDYHLVDPSPWPIVGSVAAFAIKRRPQRAAVAELEPAFEPAA